MVKLSRGQRQQICRVKFAPLRPSAFCGPAAVAPTFQPVKHAPLLYVRGVLLVVVPSLSWEIDWVFKGETALKPRFCFVLFCFVLFCFVLFDSRTDARACDLLAECDQLQLN
eukprot:COSAG05_NODE_8483_length_699_cov_1.183333_1_plen_111_part_10